MSTMIVANAIIQWVSFLYRNKKQRAKERQVRRLRSDHVKGGYTVGCKRKNEAIASLDKCDTVIMDIAKVV